MSKIQDNYLVKGARGNFAKQFVYKRRGNNTHMARMPRINPNAEVTTDQVKVRDLFGSAALYAKGAISSPELKKEYQKKVKPGSTAYNMAFRDYLKAPVVKSIDPSKYAGPPGAIIEVEAKDDFRVAGVTVTIQTAAGVLVETGEAILNPINRNKWKYTTTVNAAPAGSKITAVARDLPGNTAKLEVTV